MSMFWASDWCNDDGDESVDYDKKITLKVIFLILQNISCAGAITKVQRNSGIQYCSTQYAWEFHI